MEMSGGDVTCGGCWGVERVGNVLLRHEVASAAGDCASAFVEEGKEGRRPCAERSVPFDDGGRTKVVLIGGNA